MWKVEEPFSASFLIFFRKSIKKKIDIEKVQNLIKLQRIYNVYVFSTFAMSFQETDQIKCETAMNMVFCGTSIMLRAKVFAE